MLIYGIVCDTVFARNSTSTGTPSYGIADPNDNNCQFTCRGFTSEACGGPGNNSPNIQRMSLYYYTPPPVSGFRDNAYVLKLKVLYLLFLLYSGPIRLDKSHTTSHNGDGRGDVAGMYWSDGFGQYGGRGGHSRRRQSLVAKGDEGPIWPFCGDRRLVIEVYSRVKIQRTTSSNMKEVAFAINDTEQSASRYGKSQYVCDNVGAATVPYDFLIKIKV
jgi:hypothetical protein